MPPRLNRVLKTRRETKGLTQVELAKRARITQSYLAELETGEKKNPSLPVLRRLAKALGVPVTALLG
jgi:transcriptional regulator with XRE-family HTH domain